MDVQLDELRLEINKLKPKVESLGKTLKISQLESELKSLELETSKQGFWDDSKNSQSVLSKISEYSSKIKEYTKLKNEFEEIEILVELSCHEAECRSRWNRGTRLGGDAL